MFLRSVRETGGSSPHSRSRRVTERGVGGVSPSEAENFRKVKKDALVQHAEERLAGTGSPRIAKRGCFAGTQS
jgi:hypothetical protein